MRIWKFYVGFFLANIITTIILLILYGTQEHSNSNGGPIVFGYNICSLILSILYLKIVFDVGNKNTNANDTRNEILYISLFLTHCILIIFSLIITIYHCTQTKCFAIETPLYIMPLCHAFIHMLIILYITIIGILILIFIIYDNAEQLYKLNGKILSILSPAFDLPLKDPNLITHIKLSSESFKKLKQLNPDITCPICLTEFEQLEKISLLRCSHYYHIECIQTVLKKQSKCPKCSAEI